KLSQRLLRRLGEVDEDEAFPHFTVHRHETVATLVEVEELVFLLDEGEIAIQVITPRVVLARELPAYTSGFFQRHVVPYQLVTAMAAHIVKRVDLTRPVAHQNDRRVDDFKFSRDIAAFAWKLFHTTHIEPGALEVGLALNLVDLRTAGVLVRAG